MQSEAAAGAVALLVLGKGDELVEGEIGAQVVLDSGKQSAGLGKEVFSASGGHEGANELLLALDAAEVAVGSTTVAGVL